jgi:hypothetical protein
MFLTATVFAGSTVLAGTVFAGTVAASSPTNSTSTLNDVEPGVLGFLVVAAMGVALVFLLKSMNKQFRKIGPKPEEDDLPEGIVSGEVLSRQDVAAAPDAGTQEAKSPADASTAD